MRSWHHIPSLPALSLTAKSSALAGYADICQGFRDKHRAAIAAGGAGVYDEISQYVMQVLGNVLNGSYPRESDHSFFSPRNLIEVRATIDEQNFDKLKTFYNSCMDTDTITKIGVKPIVDLVTEFTKVFPVDDAAWASNAPLSAADSNMFGDALAFSEKLGIETFFSSFVGADDLDPVGLRADGLVRRRLERSIMTNTEFTEQKHPLLHATGGYVPSFQ